MNNLGDFGFDTQKFYLGLLCPHRHEHGTSGLSLRYRSSEKCFECRRIAEQKRRSKARARKQAELEALISQCPIPYDKTVHKLGPICPRGHEFWNGFGLKYLNRGMCVECASPKTDAELKAKKSDRGKDYYRRNREKVLEVHRVYHAANKEKINAHKKLYRERTIERIKKRHKAYRIANTDKLAEKQRRYKQTESGKMCGRNGTRRYRTRKLSNHLVHFKPSEMQARFAEFDNRCAYCGSTNGLEADHFIPVSKGGSDCIGNYVPACSSCNSSKHNADPFEWYKQQEFFSNRRWRKILKVLGKTQDSYNQIPLL